jgi:hypothetical protein
MTTETQNDMIEFDLNDLPELPEFVVWPAGSYDVEGVSLKKVDLTFGQDEVAALEFKVKLLKINELKVANSVAPAEGSEFSWNYPLHGDTDKLTERRLGTIKKLLGPIGDAIGSKSSVEIAQKIPGLQMLITTSVYVKAGNKLLGEEDKMYSNVRTVLVK